MDMSDKRTLILYAARDIFEEKGYHDSKISEIAILAGVGKGTVYGYFDSKQSLFEEMILYFIDETYKESEKLVNNETDPINKLRALIEIEWVLTRDHGKLINVVVSRMASFTEDIKVKFFMAREKNLQMISDIIKLGVASGEFKDVNIRLVTLMFKGSFSQLYMDRTSSQNININKIDKVFDENTEAMFQIFINSIKS